MRYFFYIGGNDSAETAHIINEEAKTAGYELHCFHIPKTVDNDLRENDHTPGFASGAKFVAQAFMGDDLDNAALPGVKINVIMGRHAGFLTAAAALARTYPDAGPHLIYLPERPFDLEKFPKQVKAVVEKLRSLRRGGLGRHFGHHRHGDRGLVHEGSGQPRQRAALRLRRPGRCPREPDQEKTDISRVRADTFGYLQRSFPGVVSENDAKEAFAVGAKRSSARRARTWTAASPSAASPARSTRSTSSACPLRNVAKETRHMPDAFIASNGYDVTQAFLDYARPIVGKLPQIGRFKRIQVKK